MIRTAVTGRLGADPTERQTAKGTAMVTANAAVDVAREGSEPLIEWIGLVGFGAAADALLRCKKGDVVSAIGDLSKSRFTSRDGEERSNWSLRIEQLVSVRDQPSAPRRNAYGKRKPSHSGPPLAADGVDDLWRGPVS